MKMRMKGYRYHICDKELIMKVQYIYNEKVKMIKMRMMMKTNIRK